MKSHPTTSGALCGGFWWCLSCNAPADLADPGEAFPRCVKCGERKCEFRANVETEPRSLVPPVMGLAPDDAQPMLSVRKLPSAERPTLTQMTYEGYWLCQACGQPTKRDEQECCVLCGSSQVEFQPPTLTNT